ncbi:MAG: hypothetical protein IJ498_09045 [Akkermansia sp.]|nr:hypothetical protein [Akkermansia sp.]
MKLSYTLIAAALLSTTALAGTPAVALEQAPEFKRLSGSLTGGYATNYTGRGYVLTHSVAQGDSIGFAALKTSYDFGREGYWSFNSTIAYAAPCSGHTLYGNPDAGPNTVFMAAASQLSQQMGVPMQYFMNMSAEEKAAIVAAAGPQKIKNCNIENEFALVHDFKYTQEKWNVAFGHKFVHGGLLGVMAKHYRDQGASNVNEFFIAPEWTPAKWVSVGVTTSFSCQGITGWWFEPYVRFKAPIVGTPEDIKVAGVLEFAMSATADYFDSRYFACANGTQAFWIKFSTPWFIKKNLILTPGVSFNWLGKGGIKANKQSEFRQYSEDDNNIPFKNFGVVGSVSLTYTF